MAYDRDSRQTPPASTAPDGSGGPPRPPVPVSAICATYFRCISRRSTTHLPTFAHPQHLSKTTRIVAELVEAPNSLRNVRHLNANPY